MGTFPATLWLANFRLSLRDEGQEVAAAREWERAGGWSGGGWAGEALRARDRPRSYYFIRRRAWMELLDDGFQPHDRPCMITDENSLASRRIGDAWSGVRGLLPSYSTQGIKEILNSAGLPLFKVQDAGTYKGPILDEADKLIRDLDDLSRDRVVMGCIEEIVVFEQRKSARLSEQKLPPDNQNLESLERMLARVGYGLSGRSVFPLSLKLDIDTVSLPQEISEAIAEALRRYRDGRFAGAVTSICGAVDQVTERVFAAKSLGDHKAAAYQERISKSFAASEAEYCEPLQRSGVRPEEVKLIWENHKKSISQAAYVLAAFRREYSDAHGQQNAPTEFVQKSLDCAIYILRSFSGLSQKKD